MKPVYHHVNPEADHPGLQAAQSITITRVCSSESRTRETLNTAWGKAPPFNLQSHDPASAQDQQMS
ncbi:hypothetical protein SynA15127_01908 [Synechococcus sp. A15-127]|nr:hypothetical protein SynA15127_01908 [Synechococcus sp. A15-127]